MAGVPQTRAATVPVEWYTPPEIFAALALRFDLDPCAPPLPAAGWIPATNRVSLPADGLALDWAHRERWVCEEHPRIWLNPPYGDQCGRWIMKLAAHGRGIALVFCRTDTAWWQRSARSADAVCFIEGRVNFIAGHRDGRSASTAPSCLLAWGAAEAAASHARISAPSSPPPGYSPTPSRRPML